MTYRRNVGCALRVVAAASCGAPRETFPRIRRGGRHKVHPLKVKGEARDGRGTGAHHTSRQVFWEHLSFTCAPQDDVQRGIHPGFSQDSPQQTGTSQTNSGVPLLKYSGKADGQVSWLRAWRHVLVLSHTPRQPSLLSPRLKKKEEYISWL